MHTDPTAGGETDPGDSLPAVGHEAGLVDAQMPFSLAVIAAAAGYLPPDPHQAFVYADIGCGDGLTANAVATLYPQARVIGIDPDADRIAAARARAKHAGLANITFHAADPDHLAGLELPRLDYAAVGRLYERLTEDEAQALRGVLRERVTDGGVVTVAYASLPGRSAVAPLFEVVRALTPDAPDGDRLTRARHAHDLLAALARRGTTYATANRGAGAAVQAYISAGQPDTALLRRIAEEVLEGGFRPRYASQMLADMGEADLTFAGRSDPALNEIELAVPPAHVPTFQDVRDAPAKIELLKDTIRNEQTRRDVYVKGEAGDAGAATAWLADNLHLLTRMPAASVQRRVLTVGNHPVPLHGPAVEALIAAADGRTATPREVATDQGLPVARVVRAAVRLLASHQLFACREPVTGSAPDPKDLTGVGMPAAINRQMLQIAADELTQEDLAAPVTGGAALPVSPVEAALLTAVVAEGSFATAAERVHARFAHENRTVPGVRGRKAAKDLSVQELDDILAAMRGQKLINMLRLGIVEAG